MRRLESGTGLAALLLVALLAGSAAARAQQTTGQFIPIGFSPGVSNLTRSIGAVDAIDSAARSFSLQVDGETRTLRVTAATLIWLDRPKVRKTDIEGDFADIQPGHVIEIRYDDDPGAAVWVKIQAS